MAKDKKINENFHMKLVFTIHEISTIALLALSSTRRFIDDPLPVQEILNNAHKY